MKIIAKTKDGVLIEATTHETKEILNAITGLAPDELVVGQKIPAIDYADTIKKIKELEDHRDFKEICREVKNFNKSFGILKAAVESAKNIEV